MEPEGSLPYSQVPATCLYPEPTPSSPHDPLQRPQHRSNTITLYKLEAVHGIHYRDIAYRLQQRFPNFFQVGTTFISQNVLQTTLLLPPLKTKCLRFSTAVCYKQFTLILFFLSFLD
jgi:hypothetical protein